MLGLDELDLVFMPGPPWWALCWSASVYIIIWYVSFSFFLSFCFILFRYDDECCFPFFLPLYDNESGLYNMRFQFGILGYSFTFSF